MSQRHAKRCCTAAWGRETVGVQTSTSSGFKPIRCSSVAHYTTIVEQHLELVPHPHFY